MDENCIPILPNKTIDTLSEAMDIIHKHTDISNEEKDVLMILLRKVVNSEVENLLKEL